jgi:hypothetical protein
MLLNKQQIRDIDDLPTKVIHVPEWGGDVKLKTMDAHSRIEFEKRAGKSKTELDTIINLVMFSCVNDDGSFLFEDSDYELLSTKSAKALMRVFHEALPLSTLTEKHLEEKAKNS